MPENKDFEDSEEPTGWTRCPIKFTVGPEEVELVASKRAEEFWKATLEDYQMADENLQDSRDDWDPAINLENQRKTIEQQEEEITRLTKALQSAEFALAKAEITRNNLKDDVEFLDSTCQELSDEVVKLNTERPLLWDRVTGEGPFVQVDEEPETGKVAVYKGDDLNGRPKLHLHYKNALSKYKPRKVKRVCKKKRRADHDLWAGLAWATGALAVTLGTCMVLTEIL